MDGMTGVTAAAAIQPWDPMPPAIAKAIVSVMAEVRGIEKRGENKFHNFKFMTVGDLMGDLQPAMAKAGLFVLQTEIGAEMMKEALVVSYAFALGHASGEVWRCPLIQSGMAVALNSKGGVDDKARNKCHTAARKYFLVGLFQIPALEIGDERLLDGDGDADASPAPRAEGAASGARTVSNRSARSPAKKSDNPDDEARRRDFQAVRDAIRVAATEDDLHKAWNDHAEHLARVRAHSEAGYKLLSGDYSARLSVFGGGAG
ncbi:ERF family protein [Falsiroseomonas sp. CW058]|uniref:ERF family protein n=1 Tax=Falsiroseomonas sp. CW058 TaxID=3388664 RepID=UPI003D3194E4